MCTDGWGATQLCLVRVQACTASTVAFVRFFAQPRGRAMVAGEVTITCVCRGQRVPVTCDLDADVGALRASFMAAAAADPRVRVR